MSSPRIALFVVLYEGSHAVANLVRMYKDLEESEPYCSMTETSAYTLHSWGTDGPPILLLHGFTGHGGIWAPLAETFSGAGFRLLAPDLLGHGHSAAPLDPLRYAMEHAAADLARLLDEYTAEPVHLLGYSMGGRLALFFALRYGQRLHSLALESASPGLASAGERAARAGQDEALAMRLEREGMAAFVDFWQSLPLWKSQRRLSAQQHEQLRQQRLQNRPRGLANSLRGMGSGVQPNLWPDLPALTVPTCLLVGAEDEKFVTINRQMAARIPNARLAIVPQAGHMVHVEQPQAFARVLMTFWAAFN